MIVTFREKVALVMVKKEATSSHRVMLYRSHLSVINKNYLKRMTSITKRSQRGNHHPMITITTEIL